MFRKTLKLIGQSFFSSKANFKQHHMESNPFDAMKKDPELAKKLVLMRNSFEEARSNPAKFNFKEVKVDSKEVKKTEQAIRYSRRHSEY
jgi:hypothetical protein